MGTGFSSDDVEYEPTAGRLLVLCLRRDVTSSPNSNSEGHSYVVEVVAERSMKGAVYDISKLGSERIATGVGSRVRLRESEIDRE